MHIAILTTSHSALDTRIVYKEAFSLATAGHDVTLFAAYSQGAEAVLADKKIRFVPMRAGTSARDRLSRVLSLGSVLAKQRPKHFDAWHFHDPELLPVVPILRKLISPQVHVVYDAHEDLPNSLSGRSWFPGFLKRGAPTMIDSFERWLASGFDLVVAATETIEARLAKSSKRVVVARNYPNLNLERGQSRRSETASSGGLHLIYTGPMNPNRGVSQIVDAMKLVRDLPVRMLMLGRFYSDEYQAEVKRAAPDSITFRDAVPFTEVYSYLMQSDVGIVCSQPTTAYVDALPTKMFEYMEAGLPAIVPDFPKLRQLIDEVGCGICIDSRSPEQLASAIRKLYENPGLRAEMGRLGKEGVRRQYSWQAEAPRLLSAYASLPERVPGAVRTTPG
jgi:glycosyltransferase involved in cell wall biosynthesis